MYVTIARYIICNIRSVVIRIIKLTSVHVYSAHVDTAHHSQRVKNAFVCCCFFFKKFSIDFTYITQ